MATRKIWIDLEHAPHVQVFRPLLQELTNQGYEPLVTVRDFNQTISLCELWDIPHVAVGRHGGKTLFGKVWHLLYRSFQLARILRAHNVVCAFSHGSRTQMLAAFWLRIPCIIMKDYEYAENRLANVLCKGILMPESIPSEKLIELHYRMDKVWRYPGFKEEMYLENFIPGSNIRETLNIPDAAILVTLRPPAIASQYHDGRSEPILRAVLKRCKENQSVYVLYISRTKEDRGILYHYNRDVADRLRLLEVAVDGLQLIWNSDLVISGGGTMTRESALMGVPTYSIFTGPRPHLDSVLAQKGLLTFVQSPEDVEKIVLEKRNDGLAFPSVRKGGARRAIEILCEKLAEMGLNGN